jgi:hypothetical protein
MLDSDTHAGSELDEQLAIVESQIDAYLEESSPPRLRIQALLQHAADLRTDRNTCTSFLVQLPPEVAARVLYLSQCAAGGAPCVPTPWIDFDPNWTRLMLVCRYLRSVAVSTPHLWSFVHYRSRATLRWFELCMTRAKETPLDLCGAGFNFFIDAWGTEYPDLARRVRSARRLCMPIPERPKCSRSMDMILEKTLPRIEELHCFRSASDRESVQHTHSLSPHFLGGASATLTRLTLHDVVFSNTNHAPSLPALVYLDIHMPYIREKQYMHELVAFLHSAPLLEQLSIKCDRIQTRGKHKPLALHHLRTLIVQGGHTDLLTFNKLIPLPSHHLSIVCLKQFRKSAEDAPMRDIIQRFWTEATDDASLPLPAGHFEILGEQVRLMFGVAFDLEISAAEHCPRLFFQAEWSCLDYDTCMPLDSVEGLVLSGGALCAAERVSGLGPLVRRITISHANNTYFMPPDFMDWLRERVQRQNPMELIEFVDCAEGIDGNTELISYAEQIMVECLADEVIWR